MKNDTLEHFHDSVISNYKEMIHEALLESEIDARTHLDEKVLNKKMREITSSAKFDGLTELEINALIDVAMKDWISHHTKAKVG